MSSPAKKLLTEPLLWVGAIALCIPLFASSQMNMLRNSFRANDSESTPVVVNTKPTVDPIFTTEAKPEIAAAIDSGPSTDLAMTSKTLPEIAALTSNFSTPSAKQTESTTEVSISRLPTPEPNRIIDPGSLMEAANSFGYEMTTDPAIAESSSEPANFEDLELTFNDESENAISLDPIAISPPSVQPAESKTKFVELPQEIAYPTAASPMPQSQEPQFAPSRRPYSRPATPMRFQAALPQGYSYRHRLTETSVDQPYRPAPAQEMSPSQASQNQLDAIRNW